MAKIKLTKVPFAGTPAQESALRAMLDGCKTLPGGLMPALQKAQEIYGYLPIEVQKIIAEEMGISLEEVFGVATFYSQFTLNPHGKYNISVCLGTACYVKGAGNVLEEIEKELKLERGGITPDGKFSILETRCVGCCGLAPVLTVNEHVYGKVTPEAVAGIIAEYNK